MTNDLSSVLASIAHAGMAAHIPFEKLRPAVAAARASAGVPDTMGGGAGQPSDNTGQLPMDEYETVFHLEYRAELEHPWNPLPMDFSSIESIREWVDTYPGGVNTEGEYRVRKVETVTSYEPFTHPETES